MVASSRKAHLLMGVDGRLACRRRIWVRRITWRAPPELTCPVCRLVVKEGRRRSVAEALRALTAPSWYAELDRPTLPAEA